MHASISLCTRRRSSAGKSLAGSRRALHRRADGSRAVILRAVAEMMRVAAEAHARSLDATDALTVVFTAILWHGAAASPRPRERQKSRRLLQLGLSWLGCRRQVDGADPGTRTGIGECDMGERSQSRTRRRGWHCCRCHGAAPVRLPSARPRRAQAQTSIARNVNARAGRARASCGLAAGQRTGRRESQHGGGGAGGCSAATMPICSRAHLTRAISLEVRRPPAERGVPGGSWGGCAGRPGRSPSYAASGLLALRRCATGMGDLLHLHARLRARHVMDKLVATAHAPPRPDNKASPSRSCHRRPVHARGQRRATGRSAAPQPQSRSRSSHQ